MNISKLINAVSSCGSSDSRIIDVISLLGRSIVFSVLALPTVNAAVVGSAAGNITYYYVYPDIGGGDVQFSIDSDVPGCSRFWLRPSDPGFKTAFATLMMAYAAKSLVSVWAYDDSLWPSVWSESGLS